MKKILLLSVLGLGAWQVQAQQRLTDAQGQPLRFADVVETYRATRAAEEQTEVREEEFEGGEYQFERWKWYWQHHVDKDGFMVSAGQNFVEYLKSAGKPMSKTTLPVMADWKFRGPATSQSGYGGIGRVNCVEFHPTDTNTYWIGASGGGIWKTTNGGLNWTNLSANLPRLDVSDIDVNRLNTKTIYLCTGDRDGGSASYNNNNSIGVLKSLDGGITWNTTGINWTTSQGRTTNWLVINPSDTNRLILATSNGIYKSYNGGTNWTSVQSGNFSQVIYHPTDTAIVYAARNDGDREIYRSTNGGTAWSIVTNFNDARRIALAVTPASPNLVRAMVCNNTNGLMGIYESTNSGASFTQKYAPTGTSCNTSSANVKVGDLIVGSMDSKGCGNQGWYDLAFAISPTDASIMYAGGVNTYRSTNGGTSWTLATQWWSSLPGLITVHADKHYYAIHPQTGAFFECNDGGIYKTHNPASSLWTDMSNGLGITQFYRNAVSSISTIVIAGAQDNGTKGVQGGVWSDLTGGDGMDCQVDPLDSNIFYTSTQNGNLNRTINGGGNYVDIQNNIPGKPSGSWITPFIITPDSSNHLIAGYKHIYFSADRGDSWMSIQGTQVTAGNCERVAMTGGKKPTIYAIYPDTQVVFYADNYVRGATATFDTINVPYTETISDIKPHPVDSGRFYLTFSGYGTNKVAEYNKGVWTQHNAGLPAVPVRCFEYDTSTNIKYVGTDIGVYYMDTTTAGMWAAFTKNMPPIEVLDMGINYKTKEIWAATYGRGMWSSLKQEYINPADTTDTTDTTNYVIIVPYAEDVFTIAPNPSDGVFKVIAGPSIEAGKAILLNIFDYTGKLVYSRQSVLQGNKSIEVHAGTLAPGAYIAEMKDVASTLGRRRFVVQ